MPIRSRQLSLTNLETLCCIARVGTFHAAAEQMNTTQSAVSGRVRELENSTGMTLFQRHGRRMELTIQGRELVRRVEPLLRNIEDLVVSLDNPSAAMGTVRIGVGEVVGLSWLGDLIAKAKALMPNVDYEIDVNLNMIVRQKLENGKLDLAISSGPFDKTSISTIPAGRTRFIWVMSPTLAARYPPDLNLKEMLEHVAVWALPQPAAMFPATQAALRRVGTKSIDINTCGQLSVLSKIIIAGGGLALLPENLVAEDLKENRLVRVSQALKPEDVEFLIAWHTDLEHSILRHVINIAVACTTFSQSDPIDLPRDFQTR
jgi:DNA-binding transcriptional LysR family regulator